MAEKKMTPDFKETILDMLSHIPNITAVSRLMGVRPVTIYDARKKDPEFDAAVIKAVEIGYDTLEEEARRRAVDGVKEPVFFQGERVDEVVKYSDDLLKFLLRGYRPKKFNPGVKVEGADGTKVSMTFNLGGD